MQTCAFTGYRPARFSFGYNEESPLCLRIKAAMKQEIQRLYDDGVRAYLAGGAIGTDMWASEIVCEMMERYPDITLTCVIPFRGHDSRWPEHSRARLRALYAKADVIVVSDHSSMSAYHKRNRYLVDNADQLIAICNVDALPPNSGTAQTLAYARAKGLGIIVVHSETARILREK